MATLADELEKVERRLIKEALAQTRRDAERAAAKLGITLDDLIQRSRRLKIPLLVVRRKRPRRQTEYPQSSLTNATRELERRWMREALEATGGDVRAAAASINMPPSRFYLRLREFDMRVVRGKPNKQARPRGKLQRRDITTAIEKLKTRLLREALETTDGDLTRVAGSLGISRTTLHRLRRAIDATAG